jgi:hypothetical protein
MSISRMAYFAAAYLSAGSRFFGRLAAMAEGRMVQWKLDQRLRRVYADAGSSPSATLAACALGLFAVFAIAVSGQDATRPSRAQTLPVVATSHRVSLLHAQEIYGSRKSNRGVQRPTAPAQR